MNSCSVASGRAGPTHRLRWIGGRKLVRYTEAAERLRSSASGIPLLSIWLCEMNSRGGNRTMSHDPEIRLDLFSPRGFDRGRSKLVELAWLVVDALFVRSWVPGSKLRISILRAFGAQIADGVVIKPRVRIKFPWKLQVGAYSWIGEDVWIDNLATVKIGEHCCISQGAYLCTGGHNYRSVTFDLVTRPIVLARGVWICARTCVGPGVTIGEAAVLTIGSVATKDLSPWTIYSGTQAVETARRKLNGPHPEQQGRFSYEKTP